MADVDRQRQSSLSLSNSVSKQADSEALSGQKAQSPYGLQTLLIKLAEIVLKNKPLCIYECLASALEAELDRRTLTDLQHTQYSSLGLNGGRAKIQLASSHKTTEIYEGQKESFGKAFEHDQKVLSEELENEDRVNLLSSKEKDVVFAKEKAVECDRADVPKCLQKVLVQLAEIVLRNKPLCIYGCLASTLEAELDSRTLRELQFSHDTSCKISHADVFELDLPVQNVNEVLDAGNKKSVTKTSEDSELFYDASTPEMAEKMTFHQTLNSGHMATRFPTDQQLEVASEVLSAWNYGFKNQKETMNEMEAVNGTIDDMKSYIESGNVSIKTCELLAPSNVPLLRDIQSIDLEQVEDQLAQIDSFPDHPGNSSFDAAAETSAVIMPSEICIPRSSQPRGEGKDDPAIPEEFYPNLLDNKNAYDVFDGLETLSSNALLLKDNQDDENQHLPLVDSCTDWPNTKALNSSVIFLPEYSDSQSEGQHIDQISLVNTFSDQPNDQISFSKSKLNDLLPEQNDGDRCSSEEEDNFMDYYSPTYMSKDNNSAFNENLDEEALPCSLLQTSDSERLRANEAGIEIAMDAKLKGSGIMNFDIYILPKRTGFSASKEVETDDTANQMAEDDVSEKVELEEILPGVDSTVNESSEIISIKTEEKPVPDAGQRFDNLKLADFSQQLVISEQSDFKSNKHDTRILETCKEPSDSITVMDLPLHSVPFQLQNTAVIRESNKTDEARSTDHFYADFAVNEPETTPVSIQKSFGHLKRVYISDDSDNEYDFSETEEEGIEDHICNDDLLPSVDKLESTIVHSRNTSVYQRGDTDLSADDTLAAMADVDSSAESPIAGEDNSVNRFPFAVNAKDSASEIQDPRISSNLQSFPDVYHNRDISYLYSISEETDSFYSPRLDPSDIDEYLTPLNSSPDKSIMDDAYLTPTFPISEQSQKVEIKHEICEMSPYYETSSGDELTSESASSINEGIDRLSHVELSMQNADETLELLNDNDDIDYEMVDAEPSAAEPKLDFISFGFGFSYKDNVQASSEENKDLGIFKSPSSDFANSASFVAGEETSPQANSSHFNTEKGISSEDAKDESASINKVSQIMLKNEGMPDKLLDQNIFSNDTSDMNNTRNYGKSSDVLESLFLDGTSPCPSADDTSTSLNERHVVLASNIETMEFPLLFKDVKDHDSNDVQRNTKFEESSVTELCDQDSSANNIDEIDLKDLSEKDNLMSVLNPFALFSDDYHREFIVPQKAVLFYSPDPNKTTGQMDDCLSSVTNANTCSATEQPQSECTQNQSYLIKTEENFIRKDISYLSQDILNADNDKGVECHNVEEDYRSKESVLTENSIQSSFKNQNVLQSITVNKITAGIQSDSNSPKEQNGKDTMQFTSTDMPESHAIHDFISNGVDLTSLETGIQKEDEIVLKNNQPFTASHNSDVNFEHILDTFQNKDATKEHFPDGELSSAWPPLPDLASYAMNKHSDDGNDFINDQYLKTYKNTKLDLEHLSAIAENIDSKDSTKDHIADRESSSEWPPLPDFSSYVMDMHSDDENSFKNDHLLKVSQMSYLGSEHFSDIAQNNDTEETTKECCINEKMSKWPPLPDFLNDFEEEGFTEDGTELDNSKIRHDEDKLHIFEPIYEDANGIHNVENDGNQMEHCQKFTMLLNHDKSNDETFMNQKILIEDERKAVDEWPPIPDFVTDNGSVHDTVSTRRDWPPEDEHFDNLAINKVQAKAEMSEDWSPMPESEVLSKEYESSPSSKPNDLDFAFKEEKDENSIESESNNIAADSETMLLSPNFSKEELAIASRLVSEVVFSARQSFDELAEIETKGKVENDDISDNQNETSNMVSSSSSFDLGAEDRSIDNAHLDSDFEEACIYWIPTEKKAKSVKIESSIVFDTDETQQMNQSQMPDSEPNFQTRNFSAVASSAVTDLTKVTGSQTEMKTHHNIQSHIELGILTGQDRSDVSALQCGSSKSLQQLEAVDFSPWFEEQVEEKRKENSAEKMFYSEKDDALDQLEQNWIISNNSHVEASIEPILYENRCTGDDEKHKQENVISQTHSEIASLKDAELSFDLPKLLQDEDDESIFLNANEHKVKYFINQVSSSEADECQTKTQVSNLNPFIMQVNDQPKVNDVRKMPLDQTKNEQEIEHRDYVKVMSEDESWMDEWREENEVAPIVKSSAQILSARKEEIQVDEDAESPLNESDNNSYDILENDHYQNYQNVISEKETNLSDASFISKIPGSYPLSHLASCSSESDKNESSEANIKAHLSDDLESQMADPLARSEMSSDSPEITSEPREHEIPNNSSKCIAFSNEIFANSTPGRIFAEEISLLRHSSWNEYESNQALRHVSCSLCKKFDQAATPSGPDSICDSLPKDDGGHIQIGKISSCKSHNGNRSLSHKGAKLCAATADEDCSVDNKLNFPFSNSLEQKRLTDQSDSMDAAMFNTESRLPGSPYVSEGSVESTEDIRIKTESADNVYSPLTVSDASETSAAESAMEALSFILGKVEAILSESRQEYLTEDEEAATAHPGVTVKIPDAGSLMSNSSICDVDYQCTGSSFLHDRCNADEFSEISEATKPTRGKTEMEVMQTNEEDSLNMNVQDIVVENMDQTTPNIVSEPDDLGENAMEHCLTSEIIDQDTNVDAEKELKQMTVKAESHHQFRQSGLTLTSDNNNEDQQYLPGSGLFSRFHASSDEVLENNYFYKVKEYETELEENKNDVEAINNETLTKMMQTSDHNMISTMNNNVNELNDNNKNVFSVTEESNKSTDYVYKTEYDHDFSLATDWSSNGKNELVLGEADAKCVQHSHQSIDSLSNTQTFGYSMHSSHDQESESVSNRGHSNKASSMKNIDLSRNYDFENDREFEKNSDEKRSKHLAVNLDDEFGASADVEQKPFEKDEDVWLAEDFAENFSNPLEDDRNGVLGETDILADLSMKTEQEEEKRDEFNDSVATSLHRVESKTNLAMHLTEEDEIDLAAVSAAEQPMCLSTSLEDDFILTEEKLLDHDPMATYPSAKPTHFITAMHNKHDTDSSAELILSNLEANSEQLYDSTAKNDAETLSHASSSRAESDVSIASDTNSQASANVIPHSFATYIAEESESVDGTEDVEAEERQLKDETDSGLKVATGSEPNQFEFQHENIQDDKTSQDSDDVIHSATDKSEDDGEERYLDEIATSASKQKDPVKRSNAGLSTEDPRVDNTAQESSGDDGNAENDNPDNPVDNNF